MKLDILQPKIFNPMEIISGVTKKNLHIFPETGLSVAPAKIFTWEEALAHRRILAEQLNVDFNKMWFQKQVHEMKIVIVSGTAPDRDEIHDGMLSNEPGIILSITIADCCAILIYDPVKRAIAALHSGWRGTKANIASKGIAMMNKEFGSAAEDLLAYLSPCASGRNYYVGAEFLDYFPGTVTFIPPDKYLFDNQKEIKKQLLEYGIAERNIEASDICTLENADYHSLRRDGAKSGRMAAFVGMKT